MARSRDGRGSRYYDDGEYLDEDRERTHRRRHRTHEHEYDDEYSAARRDRRERRRQAEQEADALRARRESYYSRTDPEPERYRDQERMAQATRTERAKASRSSHRDIQRDSTRSKKPKKREVIADDRSEDQAYGQPRSGGYMEEVTVRRSSTRKRSDAGGSSSRTAYTPHSGSGSASVRRVEVPKLSR